jgi:hypothetical protein
MQYTYVPLTFQADESIFVIFRKAGETVSDPIVQVRHRSDTARRKLLIHRANVITTGQKSANTDITKRLHHNAQDGGLIGTIQDVAGVDRSPFWQHTLDLEYEWNGIRTRVLYGRDELIRLPKPHLTDSSWVPEIIGDHQNPAVRIWKNGIYDLIRASGKTETVQWRGIPTPKIIDEVWDVTFPPSQGLPEQIRLHPLMGWSEHPDMQIRQFSGTARLRTQFEWDEEQFSGADEIWLDLGDVQVIAEVTINGTELGTLWAPPYRTEVGSYLRAGENTLEIKVTNLWVNRLIGDANQADDCKWFENGALAEWPDWLIQGKPRPSKKRISFTTWKHWDADDVPPPSGLRGPVVLRSAKRFDLIEIP